MVNDISIQDLIESIKSEPVDTTSTYNAVVSRVDNEGVAWVHLEGSAKETPTAFSSAELHSGDVVSVELRNNKL